MNLPAYNPMAANISAARNLILDPKAADRAGLTARRIAWGILKTERGQRIIQHRINRAGTCFPGGAA